MTCDAKREKNSPRRQPLKFNIMKNSNSFNTSFTTSANAETAQESTSKTFRTTYAVAVNWLKSALIMCNHIWQIDDSIIDNIRFDLYDDEGHQIDIYQTFITSCSESDVEFLEKHFGLLFSYSDLLDCFVLVVNHYGTAWEYVMIDTDLEQAEAEIGTKSK